MWALKTFVYLLIHYNAKKSNSILLILMVKYLLKGDKYRILLNV